MIFSLSNGLTTVLEVAPAIPPATKYSTKCCEEFVPAKRREKRRSMLLGGRVRKVKGWKGRKACVELQLSLKNERSRVRSYWSSKSLVRNTFGRLP